MQDNVQFVNKSRVIFYFRFELKLKSIKIIKAFSLKN